MMVKTTYALTVFAAVTMAAPMAPNGNDYTLIGGVLGEVSVSPGTRR